MNTRSETQYEKNEIYEVKIDFDEASKDWRENKKSIGNGEFKYICTKMTKNGNKCGRKSVNNNNICHDVLSCTIHKNK